MVYHGPSLSEAEERRLRILRAAFQVTFWGCIIVALVFPYSLSLPIVVGLVIVGVAAFYGEIKVGGRLRHHRNSR